MTSAEFSDCLTPSPLFAFGTDLLYRIHANSLTTSASYDPPSFDADIISEGSQRLSVAKDILKLKLKEERARFFKTRERESPSGIVCSSQNFLISAFRVAVDLKDLISLCSLPSFSSGEIE